MKIQDLTDKQADKWCALAQGWESRNDGFYYDKNSQKVAHHGITINSGGMSWYSPSIGYSSYNPTTNPAQWGKLMEDYKISVKWMYCDRVWESATDHNQPPATLVFCFAETPGRAAVNSVIASVYGDEVPDEVA